MYLLIAIAVLAFMLAPIIWIVPTPSQKRQARLRERARQLGLDVKVTSLPQTRRARARKEPQRQILRYTWPVQKAARQEHWYFWLTEVEPDDNTAPADIAGHLSTDQIQWPKGVVLVEGSPRGISVYWREGGADVDDVDTLASQLRTLSKEWGFE